MSIIKKKAVKSVKSSGFGYEFEPFVTGSHAYGKPGSKSDVDLVVLAPTLHSKLAELSDNICHPIRFGKLNLIVLKSMTEFRCWKEATEYMKGIKERTGATFDSDAATGVIDSYYRKAGISHLRSHESGK